MFDLITDEIIEKALDAAGRGGGNLGPVRMRAALTAVLEDILKEYVSLRGFDPDWVVAPGETLQEWMEKRGFNVETLAERTQIAPERLERILNGTGRIGVVTACKLSQGTQISPRFWLALETQYRQGLAMGRKRL